MKRGKLKRSKIGGENRNSSQSHKLAPEGSTPSPAPTVPPFTFAVTIREYTRLRVGDTILHDGVEQIVTDVNPSCARIIPVNSQGTKVVEFTPRFADKPVRFAAPVKIDPTQISANSESEILRRLGRNWRQQLAERK